MREHTYAPPQVLVVAPGDGNRVIVGTWGPDSQEIVALVLSESTAQEIGRQLLAPSVEVATQMPGPGLRGI